MTRPLQRRKNRSSLPRVRQKPPSKKHLTIKSNPLVADNWDPHLTLSQNYRRLGLSAKLNSCSGGVEDDDAGRGKKRSSGREPLNIANVVEKKKWEVGRVRVVRDGEGRIVDVLRGEKGGGGWGQPLNEEEEEGSGEVGREEEGNVGIVRQLEEASRLEKRPRPRKQSQREEGWIAEMVGKWGDDVGAMARDRKLNPMQQTEGDLRRRVKAWWKSRGAEVGDGMDVG